MLCVRGARLDVEKVYEGSESEQGHPDARLPGHVLICHNSGKTEPK